MRTKYLRFLRETYQGVIIMTDREKKKKAAMAGVLRYIEDERAVYARVEPVPPTFPGNWAFHGRQTIMINRSQMQRRLAKR